MKRIVGIIFVFLILSALLYRALQTTFQPRVEITYSLRSLYSSRLFFHSGDGKDVTLSKQGIDLHATQFYSQKTIELPLSKFPLNQVLTMDAQHPELFLAAVQVQVKQAYHQTTVLQLQGENILAILHDKKTVASSNGEYIRLRSAKGEEVRFNFSSLQHALKTAVMKPRYVNLQCAFASLLLSLFICSAILALSGGVGAVNQVHVKKLPLLVPGFALIILFVFLNSIYTIIPDKESHENRNMATVPIPSVNNLFDFPDLLVQYTNDHFAFRNHLFSTHAYLRAKLLHGSALPNDVIVGKNGWLFKNNPLAIQDMRRLSSLPEYSMQQMINVLNERIQWLQARGIKYYIVVPPHPERIYREFYPDRYAVVPNFGHDRLDYYKRYLKEHLRFDLIDPTDSLMKYKQLQDVFYSTDTHWNLFGAWVAYRTLMEHIKRDFPCLQPIELNQLTMTTSFNQRGDLAAMLGLENRMTRKEITMQLKDTSSTLTQSTTSDIVLRCINNEVIDRCGLKAMVFRDSYANYLLPYLNKHFKTCTYVWTYNFMHEMIEEEKPDVVILEVHQSMLSYALHAPNLFH